MNKKYLMITLLVLIVAVSIAFFVKKQIGLSPSEAPSCLCPYENEYKPASSTFTLTLEGCTNTCKSCKIKGITKTSSSGDRSKVNEIPGPVRLKNGEEIRNPKVGDFRPCIPL